MKIKTKRKIPELLTLKETSLMLRCHENTLRAWDNKGILKAVRVGVRGDRRYKKEDILLFLKINHYGK